MVPLDSRTTFSFPARSVSAEVNSLLLVRADETSASPGMTMRRGESTAVEPAACCITDRDTKPKR